jgi:hypothetical protein
VAALRVKVHRRSSIQSLSVLVCKSPISLRFEAIKKVIDLNTSVSSADLVNFPFTDPQHLQLRAQIFVYGALM